MRRRRNKGYESLVSPSSKSIPLPNLTGGRILGHDASSVSSPKREMRIYKFSKAIRRTFFIISALYPMVMKKDFDFTKIHSK